MVCVMKITYRIFKVTIGTYLDVFYFSNKPTKEDVIEACKQAGKSPGVLEVVEKGLYSFQELGVISN